MKTEKDKFNEWLNKKESFTGFTSTEVAFVSQFFELLEDYPSLKQKMQEIGSKQRSFALIEQYLKEHK